MSFLSQFSEADKAQATSIKDGNRMQGIESSLDKLEVPINPSSPSEEPVVEEDLSRPNRLCQWNVQGDNYYPSKKTQPRIKPGVYEINHTANVGYYFTRVQVKTEGLLIFPQTNAETIINEIEVFWEREQIFRDYKIAFKRGILLYGPQGGGKSSIIQLLARRVIERRGIVIKFNHPAYFINGLRILREIHPNIPVVCLMEDLDAILESSNSESEILNLLDGIDDVDNIVF